MNNAVYGKTMNKLRNTIDVRFVSKDKNYLKLTSNQYICHKRYLTITYWQDAKVMSY